MVVQSPIQDSHLLNSVLCLVGSARVSLIASSAVEPEYMLSLSSIRYLHSQQSIKGEKDSTVISGGVGLNSPHCSAVRTHGRPKATPICKKSLAL